MAIKPILFNTEMVKAILEGRKTQTRRIVKTTHGGSLEIHDDPGGRAVLCEKKESLCHGLKPPFEPGDILWVRETWYDPDPDRYYVPVLYKADCPMHWDAEETGIGEPVDIKAEDVKWKPSIHMPKGFARMFLRVMDVRVGLLQLITEQDAISEGISRLFDHMTKAEYEEFACSIGKKEKQSECPWKNYLWHGNFGSCGMGNRISDAWPYQFSSYESPCDSFSSLWNSTVQLKEWDKYGWDANPWVWVIEFERCERPDGWH